MNTHVRTGLVFGSVMAAVYIATGLMSDNDTNKAATVVGGLIGGALAGSLFAFIMYKFVSSSYFTKSTAVELGVDEKSIFEGMANHFKGLEGVGGRLFLTNKRIIFKSHKLNIQNHLLEIPLHEVVSVENYRPGISPIKNGLRIITTQGEEKFVTNDAKKWVAHLEKALA